MKNLLFTLLIVITFSAFAEESSCKQQQSDNSVSTERLAQRGCCSWHSGVCGCSSGVVQCCDGSNSPSCRCNADDAKEIKSIELETPKS